MVGQGIVLDQHGIATAELVAPVVADATLLGQSRGRLKLAGVGLHPEVAATDIDLTAAGHPADRAADQAVCAVNPVVQTVGQAVDAGLEVLGGEALKEGPAKIGLAV